MPGSAIEKINEETVLLKSFAIGTRTEQVLAKSSPRYPPLTRRMPFVPDESLSCSPISGGNQLPEPAMHGRWGAVFWWLINCVPGGSDALSSTVFVSLVLIQRKQICSDERKVHQTEQSRVDELQMLATCSEPAWSTLTSWNSCWGPVCQCPLRERDINTLRGISPRRPEAGSSRPVMPKVTGNPLLFSSLWSLPSAETLKGYR